MIKIHINTLLLIILSLVLIGILVMLCVISYRLSKNRDNNSSLFQNEMMSRNNYMGFVPVPAMQSDFFRRSILHAENVIRGNVNIEEYSKEEKPGNDIVRTFMYLSSSEKQSLLLAMNYYQSDPFIFSETEKEFRKISANTMIPLWLVIIQEAIKRSGASTKIESHLKVVRA